MTRKKPHNYPSIRSEPDPVMTDRQTYITDY